MRSLGWGQSCYDAMNKGEEMKTGSGREEDIFLDELPKNGKTCFKTSSEHKDKNNIFEKLHKLEE